MPLKERERLVGNYSMPLRPHRPRGELKYNNRFFNERFEGGKMFKIHEFAIVNFLRLKLCCVPLKLL